MRTLLLLVLLVAGCAVRTPPAIERPNLLFLFADDLRRDALAAFGGELAPTPALHALARRGTALDDAYCMGSRHGAVCVPSRAMLLSGRALPHVRDDLAGVVTLPELLRERGYATFMAGKWHNGDKALRRAFPAARAVLRGGMSNHFAMDLCDVEAGEIVRQGVRPGHSTDLFADAAIEFLNSRRGNDEPFFAYVAFTAPHDPRDPPPAWRERLARRGRPQLPANFRGQHGLDLGKATMTVRDENLLGWPRDPELLRDQLADYRALIAHLDARIAEVLTALRDSGHLDDTIVVFASDHGLALGSHGLLGKQSVYEHSMSTPVVLAGPGVPVGARRDGLCYLLDLMPTLLAASGTPAPEGVDGRDLWPLIRGEAGGRDAIVLLYAASQRAVRVGNRKLIRLPQIDRTLLFDVGDDPDEMRDLASDPAFADVRARLEARLRAEQAEVDDELPWTAPEVQPATIDLTGKRFPPDRWQPDWIVEKYWPEQYWRRR
ncbi:MAG: sulfatase-like hydrolase/transferase [Planctomycetes bacterium]|nr:sulfatase-like hydrolase/transferase [Planctomycetota bacterium]